MDKEWQKSKEEWYQTEITKRKDVIIKGIDSSGLIAEDKKKELIDKLNKGMEHPEPYGLYGFCLDLRYGFFFVEMIIIKEIMNLGSSGLKKLI